MAVAFLLAVQFVSPQNVIASDGSNANPDHGFTFDGLNYGSGFGAWHGGTKTGDSTDWGTSSTPPNGFDIWNNQPGTITDSLPFNSPLAAGKTFSLWMTFYQQNSGESEGFSLLDSKGDVLFTFAMLGRTPDNKKGSITDASGNAYAGGFIYNYTFQTSYSFTLTSATTYTFTEAQGGSYSGTLANGAVISQVRFFKNTVTSDDKTDFKFGSLAISNNAPGSDVGQSASPPVQQTPVAGRPWKNSLEVKFVPAGTDGVLFSIWDVRVKDFQAFVDATGYNATADMGSLGSDGWQYKGNTWKHPGFAQTDDCPVAGVSGNDAKVFCQWLTKKERAEGKLASNQEYRLPTNAEWDKAAGSTHYPWGDDWPPPPGAGNFAGNEAHDGNWPSARPTIKDYDDGYPRTSPVGSFNPNAYGLYDMGGNGAQACVDGDEYTGRGGSWTESDSGVLVSSNKWHPDRGMDNRGTDGGFRVVLAVSPPLAAVQQPAAAPSASPEQHTAPTVKLPEDQARAVVLIAGDNAEGTGFLVKTADGPVVVTNIHVISNNPNLKITTNTGAPITILSYKGATDRDMAMIAIKDGPFKYLDLATDVSGTVQPGDEVITPGNSEGGGVMLNTDGKVLGIGPDRVEFDNPIYHGNSGGPVIHVKSGKVIGIVTEGVKVDVSDELDKASFASRNSAISGSMRYFGFRLDNVPGWEAYDWRGFQAETAFLDQFDKRNRCLDSYFSLLNASASKKDQSNEDTEDANLFRTDPRIMKAIETCFQQITGDADISQRDQAVRELVADLNAITDTDMDAIQNPNNFYSFDRQRAKEEIAYRKALKTWLNTLGDNVNLESSLPRTNN